MDIQYDGDNDDDDDEKVDDVWSVNGNIICTLCGISLCVVGLEFFS